jgi:hypothetical protein
MSTAVASTWVPSRYEECPALSLLSITRPQLLLWVLIMHQTTTLL